MKLGIYRRLIKSWEGGKRGTVAAGSGDLTLFFIRVIRSIRGRFN
ncbi:MAG: hypothetical protein U0930_04015 [Pirellulales bacterium]